LADAVSVSDGLAYQRASDFGNLEETVPHPPPTPPSGEPVDFRLDEDDDVVDEVARFRRMTSKSGVWVRSCVAIDVRNTGSLALLETMLEPLGQCTHLVTLE
jgi:hypothetical protein